MAINLDMSPLTTRRLRDASAQGLVGLMAGKLPAASGYMSLLVSAIALALRLTPLSNRWLATLNLGRCRTTRFLSPKSSMPTVPTSGATDLLVAQAVLVKVISLCSETLQLPLRTLQPLQCRPPCNIAVT